MLIELLVALIIIGLIFWALKTLAPALSIPQPIITVIYVILVVIVVLYLVGLLTGHRIVLP